MTENRRNFLKKSFTSLFFISGSILINPLLLAETFSKEELILLGLKKPHLCEPYNLQNKASEAFHEMKIAAWKDGINLFCVSGYRSYYHQNSIFSEKYHKIPKHYPQCQKIFQIINDTSIPGTSRHHWGTEVDVIDQFGKYNESNPLIPENYTQGGPFQYLNYWIKENASKFGFYIAYNKNENRCGFNYEPWHLSFKELSLPMLRNFININFYKFYRLRNDIAGINFIRNRDFLKYYRQRHILGLNKNLLY